MNYDTEQDLIDEMNRPDDPCRKCPCLEEAGMFESMGAKWEKSKGEWVPITQCTEKIKRIERRKFLKAMSKGFV